MYNWRLKKGAEKKFRAGHPWVFSSELAQSPKNVVAGSVVDLFEFEGAFLARGYGHPNSMISFRTLTRQKDQAIDAAFFKISFQQAAKARRLAGVYEFSHRFVFAEGDDLPGLIVDRFRLHGTPQPAQVLVMQISTAGMGKLTPLILQGLEAFVTAEHQLDATAPSWEWTALVVANDSKSRALEGMTVDAKAVHKSLPGVSFERAQIVIQPALAKMAPVIFEVDFLGGQKTGFFLDQRMNIGLAASLAQNLIRDHQLKNPGQPLKVLDLCCYIGQWGTQLAHLAKGMNCEVEVSLLDASSKALDIASRNVEAQGGKALALKMDVLNDLVQLPKREYDIVICDPPAFIKKKKDLPTGTAAYHKLNREAIRRTKPGGVFVSCSCSGLLTEEEFRLMLAKASLTQENKVRWLIRGSHSPDHPQRPEFPQGTYLKSWMGVVL